MFYVILIPPSEINETPVPEDRRKPSSYGISLPHAVIRTQCGLKHLTEPGNYLEIYGEVTPDNLHCLFGDLTNWPLLNYELYILSNDKLVYNCMVGAGDIISECGMVGKPGTYTGDGSEVSENWLLHAQREYFIRAKQIYVTINAAYLDPEAVEAAIKNPDSPLCGYRYTSVLAGSVKGQSGHVKLLSAIKNLAVRKDSVNPEIHVLASIINDVGDRVPTCQSLIYPGKQIFATTIFTGSVFEERLRMHFRATVSLL